MSETDKIWLVGLTSIRRRTVIRPPAAPGKKPTTSAENIPTGKPFEATPDEAKELIGSSKARGATLDEQAKLNEAAKQPAAPEDDGLDKMTVADLRGVVERRKIALPKDANTKAEIIAAIRAAG